MEHTLQNSCDLLALSCLPIFSCLAWYLHIWPLNNMGLNCVGPLIRVFFSIVSTTVLRDPQLVESEGISGGGWGEKELLLFILTGSTWEGGTAKRKNSFRQGKKLRDRYYSRTMDMREPWIHRAKYKLYAGFRLCRASVPLTPVLFKGQL